MKRLRAARQGDLRYGHRVDDARGVPRVPGGAGRLDEHRLVRRRHHGSRARARRGRPGAEPRGARAHEAARARGDGGRRTRRRVLSHLRAGVLREDRRAHRAVARRRGVRRPLYLSHAQRGHAAPRGRRRAPDHRARGGHRCRDLPPQGCGRGELRQARGGHRDRGGRPRRRARRDREHVHLHGGLDRARCRDAARHPGRRLRSLGRATEGPRGARPRRAGDEDADRRVGESLPRLGRRRRDAPRRLQERCLEASRGQRRSPRSRRSAGCRRRRPPWIS